MTTSIRFHSIFNRFLSEKAILFFKKLQGKIKIEIVRNSLDSILSQDDHDYRSYSSHQIMKDVFRACLFILNSIGKNVKCFRGILIKGKKYYST